MDEKYTGCNIVESVVTTVPSPRPTEKKPQKKLDGKSHLLLRIIISALIVSIILVLHYFPSLPLANGAVDVLKKVLCYDIYGRSSFGVTIFG